MKRKYHKPEQIVKLLREAEAKLANSQSVEDVCRQFGISAATYYYWRKQYGKVQPGEARRFRELQKENVRLKKLVADQALDIAILKETLLGNY